MIYLRQSTASQEVQLGIFLDSTDAVTPETGLTIANTDIKLFKTGAAGEVDKNSGGATHDAGGKYIAVLDATDTDTTGSMTITCQVAGALPVKVTCVVLSAQVYDSIISGSDNLEVDLVSMVGASGTALPSTQASVDTKASQVSVDSVEGKVDVIDTNVDAILVDTGTTIPATLSGLSTFNAASDTVDVGAINGSTDAASNLATSAEQIITGSVSSGTAGSLVTDLPSKASNFWVGRIVIFTSGTLAGSASNVTASTGSTLTVNGFSAAPSASDTFAIV
jgi:hypothetical protein